MTNKTEKTMDEKWLIDAKNLQQFGVYEWAANCEDIGIMDDGDYYSKEDVIELVGKIVSQYRNTLINDNQ